MCWLTSAGLRELESFGVQDLRLQGREGEMRVCVCMHVGVRASVWGKEGGLWGFRARSEALGTVSGLSA